MATIAILTSADDLGVQMSAALRRALLRLGHSGVVMSMVKSKRFEPLPHLHVHGMKPEELAAWSRAHGVDMVIPVVERFTHSAACLAQALHLKGPRPDAIRVLSDKLLFMDVMARLGTVGAEAVVIVDAQGFERGFDGPVFVKPTMSSGSNASAPFDYRMFPSLAALAQHLDATKQMRTFLDENRNGSSVGRHMACRFIDTPETYNVGVMTIRGVSTLLVNMKLTYFGGDTTGSAVACRVSTPVDCRIDAELMASIDGIQRETGLDNLLWGLEYAIGADGRLRAIEAHTRLPQTHSVIVEHLFDEFWGNVIEALRGCSYQLVQKHPHCVRKTIPLRPGAIRAIEWPERGDVFTAWCDVVRPGFVVPRVLRRPAYEASACAVGSDIDELLERIDGYIGGIRVSYY